MSSIQASLTALKKQIRCKHEKRSGGNDYIECWDCGVIWDYRREGPEESVIRNLAALVQQQETGRTWLIAKWRKESDVGTECNDRTVAAANARASCAAELATLVPSPPEVPMKGKRTHDCGCDFGYAGGHNPTCKYSHLIAPEAPEPEKALPQWPSDYGEHNFIGETCVACGIPFIGSAGYIVTGRCPRNLKPAIQGTAPADAAVQFRKGIADIVAAINLGYTRTIDEVHKDLITLCRDVEALPPSAVLREQIATLEKERNDIMRSLEEQVQATNDAMDKWRAWAERANKAEAALSAYGQHTPECDAVQSKFLVPPCSCGFASALQAGAALTKDTSNGTASAAAKAAK